MGFSKAAGEGTPKIPKCPSCLLPLTTSRERPSWGTLGFWKERLVEATLGPERLLARGI